MDIFVTVTGGLACFRKIEDMLFVLNWVYPQADQIPISYYKLGVGKRAELFLKPGWQPIIADQYNNEIWWGASDIEAAKVGIRLTPQEAFEHICSGIPKRPDLPLTPLLATGNACGFPEKLEFGCHTEDISSLLRKAFRRDGVGYINQDTVVFIGVDGYSLDTGPWTPAFEAIRSQLEKAVIW